jgi:hypothetical protein
MEKYVHEYLTDTYYLKRDSAGRHWIYAKENYNSHFIRHINLLNELKVIYGFEPVESKLLVYRWAIKIDEDVDLGYYWSIEETRLKQYEPVLRVQSYDFESAMLPAIRTAFAKSIAQDLVSVQPMSAPKSNLMYIDYVYGQKLLHNSLTPYQKIKRVLNKIIIFIKKHLVVPNKYNTFVTQKK